MAYRELKRLEVDLIRKVHETFKEKIQKKVGATSHVSAGRFFGIDIQPFAVELAKVTLMLGKKLALDESLAAIENAQRDIQFDVTEHALPLDNLDKNICCADALLTDWPPADAIIGNPPYLDARKLTMIHGADYSDELHRRYPGIPGRADYCVYWFRRTQDELKAGGRAGLVGTNSIRQNYSREGGLDYLLRSGATITEAVSSQVWSGEAAVHVSIVNWAKGTEPGLKRLSTQIGDDPDSPWTIEDVERIPASLTAKCDVTSAVHIQANRNPKRCLEGQQPGHTGFCIDRTSLAKIMKTDPRWAEIVFPFLNGDDLLSGSYRDSPTWVIDFGEQDTFSAQAHRTAFEHLKTTVLPDWQVNAEEERRKTGKTTGEHQNRLRRWWLLKRRRGELIAGIEGLPRYVLCSAVTKRQIFEFVSSKYRPSNALKAFLFSDGYSFGVLSSGIHWAWFVARCSTLKGDYRYTPDTVFDTFPWPQSPTLAQAKAVAKAAVALRALRQKVMKENGWSLRDLYRTLEQPGANPLRDAHDQLDATVRAAYGMKARQDPLAFLLALNGELAAREAAGEPVTAPGLPPAVADPAPFITSDCVEPPGL